MIENMPEKTGKSLEQWLEIAPEESYVSLRHKQFGIVQPSTRTRVDVGIDLKGIEPTDRLEASGSFNAMVGHRARDTSPLWRQDRDTL